MPFPLIPTALGLCFLLVWVLIGGMILRDSQLAVENERDSDLNIVLPMPHGPSQQRGRTRSIRDTRQPTARVAS